MAQDRIDSNISAIAADRDVHIRPARSDRDEGRAFARYANEITEGGFRIMLGRRYEEILAHAFVRRGHGMSYEYTWFAEIDGRIAGMVSGYVAGDTHRPDHARRGGDECCRQTLLRGASDPLGYPLRGPVPESNGLCTPSLLLTATCV